MTVLWITAAAIVATAAAVLLGWLPCVDVEPLRDVHDHDDRETWADELDLEAAAARTLRYATGRPEPGDHDPIHRAARHPGE